MSFPDRLKSIMEERNMTPYRLAKESKISPTTVSNYLKGKTIPTSSILETLSNILGVTDTWLKNGDEPKYTTIEPETAYKRETSIDQDLASAIKNLSESVKQRDEYIRELINKIPNAK